MSDIAVDVSGEMSPPPMPSSFTSTLSRLTLPGAINPKELIDNQRKNLRPWLLFFHTANFRLPASMPRLTKRIMKNVEYFHTNYLCIFLILVLYCLITNPLLLIAIILTFVCGYKLGERSEMKQIVILGRELNVTQVYMLVGVCSLPIFYILGAPSVIFWLIGASISLITMHASFYNYEALTLADDDAASLLQDV